MVDSEISGSIKCFTLKIKIFEKKLLICNVSLGANKVKEIKIKTEFSTLIVIFCLAYPAEFMKLYTPSPLEVSLI